MRFRINSFTNMDMCKGFYPERPMEEMVTQRKFEAAIQVFREHGGTMRTRDATREGIHPRTLYEMRDAGILETLSRGLFRLASLSPLGNPDLVPVALRVPNCVICLISALVFHEITTEVPHAVYIALPRRAWRPDLDHPPVRVFWFKGPAFAEGIEVHEIDGVEVRVYSPEKTLADCFKHRNKIGIDVAVEALRTDELVRYAKICRVEKVMRPYLEAIL
jgi:predicted transcriptional regulator of viral defense system